VDTSFESSSMDTTLSTSFETSSMDTTLSTSFESTSMDTTLSTSFESTSMDTTLSTSFESSSTSMTTTKPLPFAEGFKVVGELLLEVTEEIFEQQKESLTEDLAKKLNILIDQIRLYLNKSGRRVLTEKSVHFEIFMETANEATAIQTEITTDDFEKFVDQVTASKGMQLKKIMRAEVESFKAESNTDTPVVKTIHRDTLRNENNGAESESTTSLIFILAAVVIVLAGCAYYVHFFCGSKAEEDKNAVLDVIFEKGFDFENPIAATPYQQPERLENPEGQEGLEIFATKTPRTSYMESEWAATSPGNVTLVNFGEP